MKKDAYVHSRRRSRRVCFVSRLGLLNQKHTHAVRIYPDQENKMYRRTRI